MFRGVRARTRARHGVRGDGAAAGGGRRCLRVTLAEHAALSRARRSRRALAALLAARGPAGARGPPAATLQPHGWGARAALGPQVGTSPHTHTVKLQRVFMVVFVIIGGMNLISVTKRQIC